ncbi:MAG: FKBP-type peptidyl-prolyl cis-trans isomerase [Oscillospiraceae bacterium]|nr:FKBP-type peptidyl-prolyl cis-trans isomerase [Oscillospiraceae bacterium]
MKKIFSRSLAAALCAGMALSLAACSSTAASSQSAASSEAAGSEASSAASAPVDPDPLAQKAADFNYSAALDENGYFTGVRALDYVTLPADYKALSVSAADVQVTDDELQTNLDYILSQFAETEQDTESTIQNGDRVNIDYVGSVDGIEFTGGNTNGQGTTVTAGSTQYVDDFLTQIIGHKPGETFDVVVTFPDGYDDSTDANGDPIKLAGQEAVFSVTINYIAKSVTPELTDEFISKNIDPKYGSTVEEFKDTVRKDVADANLEKYVTNYLTQNSVYADELPEAVTEYSSMMVLNYYCGYASAKNQTLTQFIQENLDADSIQALLDSNKEAIDNQAKRFLLYQALAEDQGLDCTDDDVKAYFEDLGTTDYSDYQNFYGTNYLRMNAVGDKAFNNILANVTVG